MHFLLVLQDPPEYFAGRFLAYTPDIPSELLRAATPPNREGPPQNRTHIAPQMDLIHHQYAQVRAGCRQQEPLRLSVVLLCSVSLLCLSAHTFSHASARMSLQVVHVMQGAALHNIDPPPASPSQSVQE